MMEAATINGGSIAFRDDGGEKPVALLVHGFALDHRMWEPQVERLGKHFRVIAPDLRGFGTSDGGPPGPLTMAQHADDLAALLDHLGIGEPILYVGLSMGGYTGFEFWRRHPERCYATVLADTKATLDDPARRAYRETMIRMAEELGSPAPALELMWPQLCAPNKSLESEIPQRLKQIMASQSARAIADGQRGMALRQDSLMLLSGISTPTLVIVGEHDELTPVHESRLIADRLPNATLHVIPGAGHMSNMEAPDEFNRALLTWHARIRSASS